MRGDNLTEHAAMLLQQLKGEILVNLAESSESHNVGEYYRRQPPLPNRQIRI
jgi:hypothetical protein